MNSKLAIMMMVLAAVCLLAIGPGGNATLTDDSSPRPQNDTVSDAADESDALDDYSAVMPQDIQALVETGQDFARRGSYRDSVRAFDRAAGLDPMNASIRIAKGTSLAVDLARYNESILAYEAAIQIDPKNADAWAGKGDALNNLGRREESVIAYDMAIEIDPGKGAAWRGKGDALRNSGEFDEALKAYDRAIRADSLDAKAWKGKSIALQALGRVSDAYDARVEAKELGISI